jgi:hypothetical protein
VTDGHALPLADWASDWPLARVRTLTELVERWPDHASGLHALTDAGGDPGSHCLARQ